MYYFCCSAFWIILIFSTAVFTPQYSISFICLIYLSLPNLHFYTTRSLIFLKVLNNVNSEYFHKSKLLLLTDLLPLGKLLELLAINQSSPERRESFVPLLLKLFHVLVVLQLAWLRISPQLSWITQSGLVPFRGCHCYCGIVPNVHAGLVLSLNIRQGLKC